MEKTQIQTVLNHLKENGNITSWTAFQDYGITRLSSIIHRLRNVGYTITTEKKTTKNRFGTCSTYAVYTYIDNTEDINEYTCS